MAKMTRYESAKSLLPIEVTPVDAETTDRVEYDELCTYTQRKAQQRWIWLALCRRTRQVPAFWIGGRTEDDCVALYKQVPESYKHCLSYSDGLEAYRILMPDTTHTCVTKKTGLTNHIERFNCTLRHKLARLTRKTLAFSKSDEILRLSLKFVLFHYNLSVLT